MQKVGVYACTDVTGFGFLGHACEMIQRGEVGLVIDHSTVPILPKAIEFAQTGLIPAGTYRNRDFRSAMVKFASGVPDWISDVLFDPQTSGGLLISVSPEKTENLVGMLRTAGYTRASIVGEMVTNHAGKIVVQ